MSAARAAATSTAEAEPAGEVLVVVGEVPAALEYQDPVAIVDSISPPPLIVFWAVVAISR